MVRFQLAFTLHDKPMTKCLRPPARHNAGLLLVPTCQHSKMDLVQTGEAVEEEKDTLLETVQGNSVLCCLFPASACPTLTCLQFMEFAKGVCNKATDRGHWADYIDPCSGLPVSRCSINSNIALFLSSVTLHFLSCWLHMWCFVVLEVCPLLAITTDHCTACR